MTAPDPGTIRVVGASGTVMDLDDAVATGLIASGVVKRVEVKEKPLTAAQKKAAGGTDDK